MNKICCDIKQSKKLIKLGIDVDTADMYRHYDEDFSKFDLPQIIDYGEGSFNKHHCLFPDDIPAWSLSALFDVLPQEIFDGEYIINITEGCDNRWVLTYDHYENRNHSYYGLSAGADNLIDACVEMIIKLKEKNLL